MLKTHSDCIVIIDDIPFMADMLKEFLAAAGFSNIVTFTNPSEALKAMENILIPALVITDFNMPDYNGIEILSLIVKKHPRTGGIIMTGEPLDKIERLSNFQVLEKNSHSFELLLKYLNLLMRGNKG